MFKRFLALLLAMALLVSVVPMSSAQTHPEDPVALLAPLWEEIAKAEDLYDSVQQLGSLQAVAATVTASPLYVPGSLQWEGGSYFTFDTTVGIPCAYSADLREKARSAEAPSVVPDVPTYIDYSKKGTASPDVYVIGPYYGLDRSFTNQYQNEAKSVAQKLGGTYTLYKTTDATVDNIAHAIQSGAVVYFDSHGDTGYVNPSNPDDFVTGATTSYLCLQTGAGLTDEDYKDKHAVYDGFYGSMQYFMVDGTAITNHMTADADTCLVWMAICLGMATDGLCAPLRAHGVDVVYGYSQSVTFDGDYMYEALFWNLMKDGLTVAESIAEMKSEYGFWDPAMGCSTYTQARRNFAAFPIVVSDEDVYPGHGNVDNYQTVNSTYTLFGNYELTAVSDDENAGTVSVDGHTVTAYPKEGYRVASAVLSPEDAGTVIQDGNVFHVTNLKADATLTVCFMTKTPTTARFYVPEGVTQEPISTYVGDSFLLPTPVGTPADPSHEYTFLGWSETDVEDTTERPALLLPGTMYQAGLDPLLYAVYSYSEETAGERSFTLVEADRSDWQSEIVITGGTQTLSADGTKTGTTIGNSAAAITFDTAGLAVSGKELTGVTDDYTYVIEAVPGTNAYTIRMKNSETYLWLASNSNSLSTTDDPTAPSALWRISFSGSAVTIANDLYTTRTLRYNKSSKLFRCYASGQAAVTLYSCATATYHYTSLSTDFPDVFEDSDLRFRAAAISLEDKIIYTAMADNSVLSAYDRCYVEFKNLDSDDERMSIYAVDEGAVFSSTLTVFRFPIYVCQMTDHIEATLYGEKNGKAFKGQSVVLSVKDFVLMTLPSMNEALQKMSVNMLEYGAMMQLHFGYRTDHLANDKLGDYASLVVTTVPQISGASTATDTGVSGVSFYRRALAISSVMELQFAFNNDSGLDLAELQANIVVDGKTFCVDGADFTPLGKRFAVIFAELLPTQADTDLRITIVNKTDGKPVSETITDRLSYAAAEYQTASVPSLVNAVNAMLNYYRLAELAYAK